MLYRSPDFFRELFKRFHEMYEASGRTEWPSIQGGSYPLVLPKREEDIDEDEEELR